MGFSIPPPSPSTPLAARDAALAGAAALEDGVVPTGSLSSVHLVRNAVLQRDGGTGSPGFAASGQEEHWTNVLTFSLNGKTVRIENPDPRERLSAYLRHTKGLTGTKVGCDEGGCGACTVFLTEKRDGEVAFRSINSCLAPLASLDGCVITTIEGIGSERDGYHPVQKRLADYNGSQCG
jgi:aerobic-type carbon monoxide dehydrogenase small subunit (CoxS/CutS family)